MSRLFWTRSSESSDCIYNHHIQRLKCFPTLIQIWGIGVWGELELHWGVRRRSLGFRQGIRSWVAQVGDGDWGMWILLSGHLELSDSEDFARWGYSLVLLVPRRYYQPFVGKTSSCFVRELKRAELSLFMCISTLQVYTHTLVYFETPRSLHVHHGWDLRSKQTAREAFWARPHNSERSCRQYLCR